MSIKLNKGPHNPGLAGPELLAYEAVASKLQGAIAVQTGRNLWGNTVAAVHTAVNGLDELDAKLLASFTLRKATLDAIGSKIVAEKLADAGYGDFHKFVLTDTQEGANAEISKAVALRYGPKFKLGQTIKKAAQTVIGYFDRLDLAIRMGVDFNGKTVNELDKANRDAADNADPARKAQRQASDEASEVGKTVAGLFLAGDEELKNFQTVVTALLLNWQFVDKDDIAVVFSEMGPIVDAAEAAKLVYDQQQADEARARAGKDVKPVTELVDTSESNPVGADHEHADVNELGAVKAA